MAPGKTVKLSKTIGEDDWETRSDFRTICEAEAIKKDPKKMEKVKAYAKQQMMECAAVASEDD